DADPTAAVTDIVWTIDASRPEIATADSLVAPLARLAERCRQLVEAPARLWLVLACGRAVADAPGDSPLEIPLWTVLTAALRVARNEHPGLSLACLGVREVGGGDAAARAAAAEIVARGPENEVFFDGDRRLVFRVQRGPTRPALPALPPNRRLRLGDRPGPARGGLRWDSAERAAPGPGEIEIAVEAAGLNFRDVMWNLGLLPEEALEDGFAGATLGMECAGTVTRVGAGVDALQPGQPVVAFASGAFASHVTVPAFAVSPRPEGLAADSASTVPVAFLTAHYSLVHLGRLSAGETVLIHGGAGAVGLAAIQIARRLGARIAATAGSEEKRAFLRATGVDLVLNSRSLSFADEVLAWTGSRRGVDVVLNSLAGEAMVRSLDCLRPFGRFIELGKRDFYGNTHVGLRPLRRNLSYFGVDVDQLIGGHADLAARLFGEVVAGFARGELAPLPHRVFAAGQVGDAFRVMQRSGHIGKIVVRPPHAPLEPETVVGRFPVDPAGVHVVIGGTRGFGLATARWLAGRGARHLVLASRSGSVAETDTAALEALRAAGVEVVLAALDVADGDAVRRLLHQLDAATPVRGVVHAAMVLDDRLMETVDEASLRTVLAPKVAGALNLSAAAAGLRLDYLLLFSSATTLFGNPGQYAYVAANGFLDGLARRLAAHGVPALAIAWGGIEDAGFLARNIDADVTLKRRFAGNLVAAQTALDGLDWAFDPDGRPIAAAYAVARIDWALARRELAATRAPTFESVGVRQGARPAGDATALLEKLRALPREEVADALLEIVVEEIARVLRLPAKEVDRHRPLAEIGMDSLMMLELRTTVEGTLQIELPMMSLSSGITPADVARKVAPLVTGEKEQLAVPGTIVSLSSSHFAADAEATTADERQAAVSAVLERARKLEGPL
ncbi:MAG: SDR family NAD(P)-dependent oxidoreductase, partial [Alphaproteobacteria bacterium]|nr:SDR family NAD(P)-dependent oxidoreductase [Alphaproteobacteria bacterium]